MNQMHFCCLQEEEEQGGDQDQEEKRWNKRTQQMLHGLQVTRSSSSKLYSNKVSFQKSVCIIIQLFTHLFLVDINKSYADPL